MHRRETPYIKEQSSSTTNDMHCDIGSIFFNFSMYIWGSFSDRFLLEWLAVDRVFNRSVETRRTKSLQRLLLTYLAEQA